MSQIIHDVVICSKTIWNLPFVYITMWEKILPNSIWVSLQKGCPQTFWFIITFQINSQIWGHIPCSNILMIIYVAPCTPITRSYSIQTAKTMHIIQTNPNFQHISRDRCFRKNAFVWKQCTPKSIGQSSSFPIKITNRVVVNVLFSGTQILVLIMFLHLW